MENSASYEGMGIACIMFEASQEVFRFPATYHSKYSMNILPNEMMKKAGFKMTYDKNFMETPEGVKIPFDMSQPFDSPSL